MVSQNSTDVQYIWVTEISWGRVIREKVSECSFGGVVRCVWLHISVNADSEGCSSVAYRIHIPRPVNVSVSFFK